MSKYMLATEAFKDGENISRPQSDVCLVYTSDDKFYYGSWVDPLIENVTFPKPTTREIDMEEFGNFFQKLKYKNQPQEPIKKLLTPFTAIKTGRTRSSTQNLSNKPKGLSKLIIREKDNADKEDSES